MEIDKRPDGLPWNVNIKEAAKIIGVSTASVRNIEKKGKLHRLAIPGHRFSTDEVLKVAGKQKDKKAVERTGFTIAEAAESAGVGREQIKEWIDSGELWATKVGERRGKTIIPVVCLIETLLRKAEAREGLPARKALPAMSQTLRIVLKRRKKKAGIA